MAPPNEQYQRVRAFREAVKHEAKERRREKRSQKSFLQNLHDDINGIAEHLRERATGHMYAAIRFSDEATLSDKLGPVLGTPADLSAAFALAVVSAPFTVVAKTANLAVAITRRFR